MTHEDVRRALATVQDPELQRSIVELGMVRDIVADDERVGATIVLTTAGCPLRNEIRAQAEQALNEVAGGRRVEVKLDAMSCEERDALGARLKAGGSSYRHSSARAPRPARSPWPAERAVSGSPR